MALIISRMKILRRGFQALLDILFAPICLNCRDRLLDTEEKENYFCKNCFSSIHINSVIFRPRPDLLLASISNYEKPVRELIYALKFNRFLKTRTPIKKLIRKYLELTPLLKIVNKENAVIVPVPLHSSKLRHRGFNQAEIIADILKDLTGMQVINALIREKNTAPQSELKNNDARTRNVKGSFRINSTINNQQLTDKQIIIVDDIYTSGATINEAAKVLKSLKPRKVVGFVLAKT